MRHADAAVGCGYCWCDGGELTWVNWESDELPRQCQLGPEKPVSVRGWRLKEAA